MRKGVIWIEINSRALIVISTGGSRREPQWRDLAANPACPALAPRSIGRTANPPGREAGSEMGLRNMPGQMSRLRPDAQRRFAPRPLDLTRGRDTSLAVARGGGASLRFRQTVRLSCSWRSRPRRSSGGANCRQTDNPSPRNIRGQKHRVYTPILPHAA
jgi:hypothetical protein